MKSWKQFFAIAALILIAAGAQPAISGVWQWSNTANNNATADPTINWAEGMSPSSVNDSARAMMAQIANYRDDISGLLTTGGTSTAYTLTTNSGLCASSSTPTNGQLLAITMNVTNGVSPAITVDACSSFPIQSSSGVPVASASLVAGSPYSMKFSTANSAWMLKGFYSIPTTVPLGGLLPFTLTTAPNSNYVIAAGQCLSTSTYSVYWTALGSPASGSCPGGTFAIIDTSGSIPAGLDTMPGFSAAGRLTSSASGCGTAFTSVGVRCANGGQSQTLTSAQIPNNIPYTDNGHSHTIADPNAQNTLSFNHSGSLGFGAGSSAAFNLAGTATSTNATGIIINPSGGNPHPQVPPVVGVVYLLRVL